MAVSITSLTVAPTARPVALTSANVTGDDHAARLETLNLPLKIVGGSGSSRSSRPALLKPSTPAISAETTDETAPVQETEAVSELEPSEGATEAEASSDDDSQHPEVSDGKA